MKVLFVSSGNSLFGISPFIRSQGESLRAKGVEVEFFLVKGKGIRGYLRNVMPLRRRQGIFDVVHAHYSYCGMVAVLASRFSRPVVVSFMGNDLLGTLDRAGRQTFRGRLDCATARLLCRGVEAIIVKSRSMCELVPRAVRGRASVIPNGVDFEVFRPLGREDCCRMLGLTPDSKHVLFLGDPQDPNKGHTLLREAWELLEAKQRGAKLLTPFPVPPERVALWLNAADALAFPSELEGSPNVIKEAMACNTPIVATDVGDVREVIEGTFNCRVVPRDATRFAEGLATVLAAGGRSDGRGRIGRLRLDLIAERIIDVYRGVQRHAA